MGRCVAMELWVSRLAIPTFICGRSPGVGTTLLVGIGTLVNSSAGQSASWGKYTTTCEIDGVRFNIGLSGLNHLRPRSDQPIFDFHLPYLPPSRRLNIQTGPGKGKGPDL